MGGQSVRKGIINRYRRLPAQIDAIEFTLKGIYDAADERSDYIEEWIPELIHFLEEFKSTCERFRQGL